MQAQGIPSEKELGFIKEVLDLSPLGAFRADTQGNCLFINRQMENILGITLKDALGKGWLKSVHIEDMPAVHAILQTAQAEKRPLFDFTYRIHHVLNGTRWCKVNARFIFDEHGEGQSYIGFVQDITDDRLDELALKEANEKLKRSDLELRQVKEQLERAVNLLDACQEISQTGGWEYDIKTNLVYRTKQMRSMLGITDDTSTFRDASLSYETEDVMTIQKVLKEAIEQHKTYDIEIRPMGSRKWFRTIGRPVVRDGRVELVRGAVTDITERKEYELALQEIKEKLERNNLLLDVSQQLSGTAGWEVNLLTGEVFWTKQNYLLYEVGEDFVPTLANTLDFYEEEDRVKLDHIAQNAVREKRSYDIEVRLITAKKNLKWVRAIGCPVIKNGEVVSVQGALMDVTQKKETELELIRAKNLAEDSARARTDFLSVMSHEIRTPLNGIIGIANLLKLHYTADQEEYITNLIFCADHLLQLINDILDLTKMESEKLELVYGEVNLLPLIKNIRNQFQSLAESKGIRLKSFIDDEVPARIVADPIRLGQILNNLVSNAIKFTEEGEVTLTVRLVSREEDKVNIHFSVRDTGIGIPEELQETIFESFTQVQQSAYRKHSGTGLGLTITRKLIELHDSRIFVRSVPGAGTEFFFDLAFGLPDEKNPSRFVVEPGIQAMAGQLEGLRLLFVEDNPINIMVARKQLEYFGVHPDCATGGREALTFLKNNAYHIALLDLHMPEIDGYALAKIIRKQYPEIHIIIFTADIMTDVKVKLAKMKIYDILNKPFAPEKMFAALLKVAQARNALLPGLPGRG